MNFVGFDPGKTGAIAWIDGDGYGAVDMPLTPDSEIDQRKVFEFLRALVGSETFVAIEKQHPRPGTSSRSMFSLGMSYGSLCAFVTGLQIPYGLVAPEAWKKEMLAHEPIDRTGTKAECLRARKMASIRVATRLFPLADLGKRQDAGRAEALLIAEYARRHYNGTTG